MQADGADRHRHRPQGQGDHPRQSDGLVMMGVSSFWQTVIKGLVIIAAVVVDQAQRRLQQRVVLRRMAREG